MTAASKESETTLLWLHWVVRVGLSVMFLYAGVPKLVDPAGFASDIANYRLLPEAWAPLFALFLPVLEICIGIALWIPLYARGGAALAGALFAVFAAAMAQAKLRGIDLECGCFGAVDRAQVSWFKVAQNVAFATLALWVVRSRRLAPWFVPRRASRQVSV